MLSRLRVLDGPVQRIGGAVGHVLWGRYVGNGTRRNGSAAGAVLLHWTCHVKRRARDSDSEVISRSPWKERRHCCHVGQPWASRRAGSPERSLLPSRADTDFGGDATGERSRGGRGNLERADPPRPILVLPVICDSPAAGLFSGPLAPCRVSSGSLKLCVALRTGVGCIAGCTALRDGDAMGAGSCCRAWRSWTRCLGLGRLPLRGGRWGLERDQP